jgi:translation elongation factor EF-4
MDVFRQRLEDEYDANVIITAPTVPYKGPYLSQVTHFYLTIGYSAIPGSRNDYK